MSLGVIPPAIVRALESESGCVCLVVGRPGTGKSLLVMELFRKFPDSVIVVPAQDGRLIEVDSGRSESSQTRGRIVAFGTPIQRQTHGSSAIDSHSLVDTLCVSKHDAILVDSWDVMSIAIDPEERIGFLSELIRRAREQRKRLVLTVSSVSDAEMRLLSHWADLVVRLRRSRTEGRVYRSLIIEKSRDMPIEQDTFLFTLHGGRFTHIPWYEHVYPPITIERTPIPDTSESRVSTGNRSLDRLIGGGIKRSGLNIFELDSLAAPYVETVYIPLISNHLQLGRPIVVVLPEGWSSRQFVEGLSRFVDRDLVRDRLVLFGRQYAGKSENYRILEPDPAKTLYEMRYEAHQLEKVLGEPAMFVMFLDAMENMYGASATNAVLAELTSLVQNSRQIAVAVLSKHQDLRVNSILHHLRLQVREICGVVSISGVSPRTGFLALRPLIAEGFLDYELIPLV
ncbi:MAG: ATP-binding protein [Candidatus Thorarchaeota archaeon]